MSLLYIRGRYFVSKRGKYSNDSILFLVRLYIELNIMRSFRVVHGENIKGKAVPFPSTQFRNRTPSGAAKKAYSRMITGTRRHKLKISLIEVEAHETKITRQNKYVLFNYVVMRKKLKKPVVRFQGTSKEYRIRYKVCAVSKGIQNMPQKPFLGGNQDNKRKNELINICSIPNSVTVRSVDGTHVLNNTLCNTFSKKKQDAVGFVTLYDRIGDPSLSGIVLRGEIFGRNIDNTCVDTNVRCAYWASKDECKKNPRYMQVKCKKSCKVCDVEKLAKRDCCVKFQLVNKNNIEELKNEIAIGSYLASISSKLAGQDVKKMYFPELYACSFIKTFNHQDFGLSSPLLVGRSDTTLKNLDGKPVIAIFMSLISKPSTLWKWINTTTKIPSVDGKKIGHKADLRIRKQLGCGIEQMWNHCVSHGDLHLGNILVTRSNTYIIDFGRSYFSARTGGCRNFKQLFDEESTPRRNKMPKPPYTGHPEVHRLIHNYVKDVGSAKLLTSIKNQKKPNQNVEDLKTLYQNHVSTLDQLFREIQKLL